MAREPKKKNIQTRSVGKQVHYSTSKLANAQAPNKHPTDRELAHQTQSKSGNISYQDAAAISIGLIDKYSFTRECITNSMRDSCKLFYITSFATCDEYLQTARDYDLVLYYAHESVAGRSTEREGCASVSEVLRMAPVVILADVDCPASIIAAFENGARGYIPTASTTLDLAIQIVRLIKAGGTFVPPSLLSLGQREAAENRTNIHAPERPDP